MINFIIDLGIMLFVIFLSFFVMLNLGVITKRILGFTNKNEIFSDNIVIGFITIIFSAELLNFFIPINWIFNTFLLAISVVYFFLNKQNLFHFFLLKFFSWLKVNYITFSLLLFSLIYWCFRSMKVPTNFDTAAYHLQSIRWINEFPVVKGLANLYPQLGFNQSYFGFLAFLNFYPFFTHGFSLGSPIFFLIINILLIEKMKEKFIGIGILAFLFFLSAHPAGSIMFSPTPDLIVGYIQLIVLIYLITISAEEKIFSDNLGLLFLLLTTIFTIKLSASFFQ